MTDLNNGNDLDAGNAGLPSSGAPDLGNQGGDGGQLNSNPPSQGGNQTDKRDDEIKTLRENNKALNKALIESRRGGKSGGKLPNASDPNGDDTFETPEGRYGIAIQLATNNLRGDLEKKIGLYPEIPQAEIARVRANPWAFASQESFLAGDWETASLEIEQSLLERAEELASKGNEGNPQGNPQPATINSNPAPDTAVADNAAPGTDEDENPWTMPMGKLEKKARQESAKLKKSS